MRTCIPLLFLLAALPAQDPKPEATRPVVVGAPAPAFRVNDETGAATAVGGASKTWTVLAFYPKASTGG